MKFTNKHDLPEGIVNAVKNDMYDKGEAKYSATELTSPPQLNRLRKLYWHELQVDVAEEIWKLFGSAVHYILEQGSKSKVQLNTEAKNINDVITEKRLYATMGGIKIGGKPDWYNPLKFLVQDYKVTQVYKVLKGDLKDWTDQANMYAWLFDENGLQLDKYQIVTILKDWKSSEYERQKDEGYPPTQVKVIDIPLMDSLSRARFVLDRVEMHEKVASITNVEELYKVSPCTDEERWHQNDTYAILKKGGKRATPGGVFKSRDEALAFLEEKGNEYELQERIGADTRCESYCPVSRFCAQYKAIQANKKVGTVELPEVEFVQLPKIGVKDKEVKKETSSLIEQLEARRKARKVREEQEATDNTENISKVLDEKIKKARNKVEEDNSTDTLLGDIDDILEGL